MIALLTVFLDQIGYQPNHHTQTIEHGDFFVFNLISSFSQLFLRDFIKPLYVLLTSDSSLIPCYHLSFFGIYSWQNYLIWRDFHELWPLMKVIHIFLKWFSNFIAFIWIWWIFLIKFCFDLPSFVIGEDLLGFMHFYLFKGHINCVYQHFLNYWTVSINIMNLDAHYYTASTLSSTCLTMIYFN